MKTKNMVLSAVALLVVCGIVAGCRPPASEKPPMHAKPVVTHSVVPVIVSPQPNFDLEVCSPANLEDTEPADVSIELPTPDLTWYAPQGLEEFSGTT